MRVDRLTLPHFKNLVKFTIDFDETSNRQVIVGRNGVGKSNVLEALTWIFRDLDLEEPSSFEYEIEYHCNKHFVKVASSKSSKGKSKDAVPLYKRTYWVASDESGNASTPSHERAYEQIPERDFHLRNRPVGQKANPLRLLPLYVFGYYSGMVSRFSNIFARHEEKYFREQITGEEVPLRPLFQAKPHHSQFAILAFYATKDKDALRFLRDEFRITGIHSVLFALREPYWWNSKPNKKSKQKTGDARFWLAGGKVAPFLDALFQNSFAPLSGVQRISISIGQEKRKERRFCFLPDQSAIQKVAKGLGNKEFFARLESLVFSDLVDPTGSDVRINIKLKNTKDPATFQDLAEGERQLLTVLGLMRFTAEKEALFLLDEPDTHLNPAWCLDYLDNLRKYGAEPANSQIIMTTHSPLTFAGMDKNEVVVMERNLAGRISAEHPVSDPKGMGFAAILTSDFFGLRSTLDKETLKKIDKKRSLAFKENLSDEDLIALEKLNRELGTLDFAQATRDPLYIEFLRAITAATAEKPALKEAAPDQEVWKIRKTIAKDIAKKLLEKKKKP